MQHVLRMPRRRVAGPGDAGVRAHQPGDLRADAGAERARRERHAGGLGPHRRPAHGSTCRRWSIGAAHDTMDPAYMEGWPRLPHGRYHHCPNGSHFAHFDDQQTYFEGLIASSTTWTNTVEPAATLAKRGTLDDC